MMTESEIALIAADIEGDESAPYQARALLGEVHELRSQLASAQQQLAAMRPVVEAAVNYVMAPSGCWQSEARLVRAAGLFAVKGGAK